MSQNKLSQLGHQKDNIQNSYNHLSESAIVPADDTPKRKATYVSGVFYKTKLCPQIHSRGRCTRSESCVFAHSLEELRSTPNLTKTKLCAFVRRGDQCPSEHRSCPFAHRLEELRHTDDLFKTKVCHMWKKGKCSAGLSCRHAHGTQELNRHRRIARSATTNSTSPGTSFPGTPLIPPCDAYPSAKNIGGGFALTSSSRHRTLSQHTVACDADMRRNSLETEAVTFVRRAGRRAQTVATFHPNMVATAIDLEEANLEQQLLNRQYTNAVNHSQRRTVSWRDEEDMLLIGSNSNGCIQPQPSSTDYGRQKTVKSDSGSVRRVSFALNNDTSPEEIKRLKSNMALLHREVQSIKSKLVVKELLLILSTPDVAPSILEAARTALSAIKGEEYNWQQPGVVQLAHEQLNDDELLMKFHSTDNLSGSGTSSISKAYTTGCCTSFLTRGDVGYDSEDAARSVLEDSCAFDKEVEQEAVNQPNDLGTAAASNNSHIASVIDWLEKVKISNNDESVDDQNNAEVQQLLPAQASLLSQFPPSHYLSCLYDDRP